jgi:hypothetical protein
VDLCKSRWVISLLPLSYYYCSRLRYYCRKGVVCNLNILFFEIIYFIWPTFWFIVKYNESNIIHVTLSLILGIALLYTIYNLSYYFNDVISVKFEDIPTFRAEARNVNPALMLLSHLLTIYLLINLIKNYVYIFNLAIALVLLIYSIIIHNIIFIKQHRYASFFILRTAKYMFVPIIYFYNDIKLFYIYI